jgi:hypothetical protein
MLMMNLLGASIDAIKKYTGTLIEASKGVGLEVNAEKSRYMLLSRHQDSGKNRSIEIANRSFKNVSQFKYLGTTVTNKILIHEKIKRRPIQTMLAIIRSRSFCLLVCCLKT